MTLCEKCIHGEVCADRRWMDRDDERALVECCNFKDTADVVEVVRCKDCVHYCLSDYRKPNEPKWCDLSRNQNEYPEPNDFCSYGEKFVTDKNVGSK